ncbi:MAG: hypothetical protein ABSG01_09985 [Anaerolineales bacterium]|jgi:hypothetical protein
MPNQADQYVNLKPADIIGDDRLVTGEGEALLNLPSLYRMQEAKLKSEVRNISKALPRQTSLPGCREATER